MSCSYILQCVRRFIIILIGLTMLVLSRVKSCCVTRTKLSRAYTPPRQTSLPDARRSPIFTNEHVWWWNTLAKIDCNNNANDFWKLIKKIRKPKNDSPFPSAIVPTIRPKNHHHQTRNQKSNILVLPNVWRKVQTQKPSFFAQHFHRPSLITPGSS